MSSSNHKQIQLPTGASVILSGLLFLMASCSDNSVPPPPKAHPELLLEIYDSTAKKEYGVAIAKIEKLRAIEKTSVFLAELENTERNNALFETVNKQIAAGNFAGARRLLEQQEVLRGANADSTEAIRQLGILIQLDALMTQAEHSRTANELKKTLANLDKTAKKIMISQKMQNFIRKKESDIKIMESLEKDRLLFSILADAGQSISEDSASAPAITALLALEDGANPAVSELLARMTGEKNDKRENSSQQ